MTSSFDYLDRLSALTAIPAEELPALHKPAQSDDYEIRAAVAELLEKAAPAEDARTLLIRLCTDADELVRINACDSLGAFPFQDALRALIATARRSDESNTVRYYALMSTTDILLANGGTAEAVSVFQANSDSECISIRAACLYGLYSTGETRRISEIASLLSAEDYHDRMSVVRILAAVAERADGETKSRIADWLIQRQQVEDAASVRALLADEIQHLVGSRNK